MSSAVSRSSTSLGIVGNFAFWNIEQVSRSIRKTLIVTMIDIRRDSHVESLSVTVTINS
jgi:hypothetical protein